jgi:predicted nuclease with TOPRIM domain
LTTDHVADYSKIKIIEGTRALESDALFRQFSEIEDKVEKLLGLCRSQQATISELQQTVKKLEEELHLKSETVQRQTEEKALIRSRIDNLLAKLEDLTRS